MKKIYDKIQFTFCIFSFYTLTFEYSKNCEVLVSHLRHIENISGYIYEKYPTFLYIFYFVRIQLGYNLNSSGYVNEKCFFLIFFKRDIFHKLRRKKYIKNSLISHLVQLTLFFLIQLSIDGY